MLALIDRALQLGSQPILLMLVGQFQPFICLLDARKLRVNSSSEFADVAIRMDCTSLRLGVTRYFCSDSLDAIDIAEIDSVFAQAGPSLCLERNEGTVHYLWSTVHAKFTLKDYEHFVVTVARFEQPLALRDVHVLDLGSELFEIL